MPGEKLSSEELARYDRQLPLFGIGGQAKLKNVSVLIAGVGGLGSFEAMYLAALGVGRLVLVDADYVDITNLNRQVLYWTEDIGKPKPYPAAEKLRRLNPNVEVVVVRERITPETASRLVKDVDVVIDGLDNWETRLILDEAAYRAGKPYIHAGVYGFQGQVVVVVPGETPCLRCLLPPFLRTPERIIAISPVVGIVAGIVVMELVKLVTGIGRSNKGRMIIVDTYNMEFMNVELKPRKGCMCPEPGV
ncbi:HesA/MoeB/ThiF family protein [Hyperthermus butylicus]|uniref:Dinucleotide-utilizing enzyme n=1 Tax=Hyperthermus butylicus (strain DSM 5456 / JCM 9403 / PLM1-5) TaxID=415426 RepID=A2BKB4_HYPBU|nr:HesA/MoeB/ThiF family protein [Hyperthermus butylicus]ABM80425.1 dinucleotide-utilizing enzyme [Hyperthermus butylicus DSM 5456]